jgi:hypothetical protein
VSLSGTIGSFLPPHLSNEVYFPALERKEHPKCILVYTLWLFLSFTYLYLVYLLCDYLSYRLFTLLQIQLTYFLAKPQNWKR